MAKLKFYDPNSDEWVEIDAPDHTHKITSLVTSEPAGKIFGSDGSGRIIAIDDNGNAWQIGTFNGDKILFLDGDLDGISLNDLQMYYRDPGDLNHSMGWGYYRHNVDGPVLNGFEGGAFAMGDANEAEDILVGGWDEGGLWTKDEGYVAARASTITVIECGDDLEVDRPDGAVICYWVFDDPSVDVGANGENIVNSGPADLFYVPEN